MNPGEMVKIATRAFNTPLLLDPRKATVIAQNLGPRFLGLGGADVVVDGGVSEVGLSLTAPRPQAASMIGDELHRRVKKRGGAYSNIMGVAVIPVTGTLARRGSYVGESSGVTSYEGLSAQIRAAVEDPDVRAIALEVDSFGGEAAGVFDLAAQIREAREKKPVHAFLAEYALSAGYAIAAQADTISIPPFGEAGSIGVVCMHVDMEDALKKEGIQVTLIHSGAHKVDGNPYQHLPEEVRSDLQQGTDQMWIAFAELVEKGRRGKLSMQSALETEARVYRGQAAVDAGLVDQVSEARAAFNGLVAQMNPPVAPVGQAAATGGMVRGVPVAATAILAGQGHPVLRPKSLETPGGVSMSISSGSGCVTGADSPTKEEVVMKDNDQTPAAESQPEKKVEAPTVGPDTQTQDAVAAETERSTKILGKVESAGLPVSFASKLIADKVSLEVAYEKILDAKVERAQDGGDIDARSHGTVLTDARENVTEGLTRAILAKAGIEGGERNEFTGMTLREMARVSLQAQGIDAPRGGVMALASAAFAPAAASGGMHSTSDFTSILANVANKSMLKGFTEASEIYESFTSVGSLSDFKATKRVGMDDFPELLKVAEGAEFKYGTIGDYAETAMLATYGRLFAITRQTIINDDLDAFTKIPAKMGRAAKRTVGDLVFAVLTGNPTMSDGTALFHADHGNLAGSGAAPSEATINAAITAMATQTDRAGNSKLNIAPKFLIAPPSQRSAVLQALNSEHAPDDTSKVGTAKQPRAYNTVRDAAEPLFDARLDGTSWFMTADPMQYDTIEVGYLDGQSTPYLDQQDGWTVDGTEFKVRIDAAATALAYQAMYKNAGS